MYKTHCIGTSYKNRIENIISAKVAQSSVCPCLQLTVATVLFLIQSTFAMCLVIKLYSLFKLFQADGAILHIIRFNLCTPH